MRDYYTIPLGDGYIEHHDHGAKPCVTIQTINE